MVKDNLAGISADTSFKWQWEEAAGIFYNSDETEKEKCPWWTFTRKKPYQISYGFPDTQILPPILITIKEKV